MSTSKRKTKKRLGNLDRYLRAQLNRFRRLVRQSKKGK